MPSAARSDRHPLLTTRRGRGSQRPPEALAGIDLDEAVDAYIACALWCSGNDDEPLSERPLAPQTRERMHRDVEAFCVTYRRLLAGIDARQIGLCLWLDRSGAGAGFADDHGAIGEQLSQAAARLGEYDLYLGDDGVVYGA